jgi:hypothetical protein
MRVILDFDENVLEKLEELAKLQKRSRKNFMEYVLINYTETAEYISPETIISTKTPKTTDLNKTTNKVANITEKPPELNHTVNAKIQEEIDKLTLSMNSCGTTGYGKQARIGYQNQIDNLKKLL